MKKKLFGVLLAMIVVFVGVLNIGTENAQATDYPEEVYDIHWGDGDGNMYVWWAEVPGAAKYHVSIFGEVDTHTIGAVSTYENYAQVNITFTGDYYAVVFAESSEGKIIARTEGPVKHFDLTPLGTPKNIKAETSKFTWDKVSGASHYKVSLVAYDPDHPYESDTYGKIYTITDNYIEYSKFSNALDGKKYYLSVQALNENSVDNLYELWGDYGKSKYFVYTKSATNFSRPEYKVTTSVSGYHGTISDSTTVYGDSNYTVKLNPDTGYGIKSLLVNGVDVTDKVDNNKYQISHISEDITVVVSYGLSDGWFTTDDGKIYLENGKPVTGFKEINAKWYYFDANGIMQTGWKKIDSKWYYFGGSGVMAIRWKKIGAKWYYFDASGIMQTGWKKIDSKWYYFDATGAMATGWKKVATKWYYFDSEGIMQTGWQEINSKWYYFDATGAMKTGWLNLITKYNSWYYFDENGVMQTGWKKIGTNWYYFEKDGSMCRDWKCIDGGYYYFDNDGVWKTGWIWDHYDWYYGKANGTRVTGWFKLDDKWYYFNDKGRMQTGWIQTGGKYYYCKDNGVMATAGWLYANNNWYYLDEDCAMVTGWKKINGAKHYFDWTGRMVTGEQRIDGKKYKFNEYGILQ